MALCPGHQGDLRPTEGRCSIATIRSRAPRDRSKSVVNAVDEVGSGPYTVHADCILTRRKRHHIIENSDGGVAFRSRWFSDCIEWLEAQGETHFQVATNRYTYEAAVSPLRKSRRE